MRLFPLGLVLLAGGALAAPRARVNLSVAGQRALAPGLLETTSELLRRIDVEVGVNDDAGADEVSVRLDVQDTQTLVTLDRARDGVHGVRHVRRASTPEVHVEVVAHVVQAAVEALLAEEATPVTAVTVEPPLPAPPLISSAPPDEVVDAGAREGFSLALGGHVGGRMVSGETLPSLSVGLLAETRWRIGALRPGGWLTVDYTLPVTVTGTQVGLRLHTISARLVPSLTLLESAKLALDVGVGLGLDVFIAQATSTSLPSSTLRPPRPEAVPVLATMLTLQWHATQHLHLFLSAGLDYDLQHKRFVSELGGVREAVFDPWRFRPTLMIGVSYDVVQPKPGATP